MKTPVMLPRSGELSLSFVQQRIWLLDRVGHESACNHVQLSLLVTGPLDILILDRSLNETVRRHEALRTTFVEVAGEPTPRIASALHLEFALVELPKGEAAAEVRRLVREEVRRPFDLAQGPLLRATLFRLKTEEHVLLVVMHPIVSDDRSMGLFWRELAALYGAFSEGKPSPLPELPLQYGDFAAWQRRWLQGAELESQLGYWSKQLNAVTLLALPTDRTRPAVQTTHGARIEFVLPQALSEALRMLSRREGTTLFMTLLSAYQLLLHRYCAVDDIAVGVPVANRSRVELEGLIGSFVNTLVMRTDLAGNPTFRELLGRVREVVSGAYAHQDLPFENLVEELAPQQNPSHTPLFQVMLVLQDAPCQAPGYPGLKVEPFVLDTDSAKFDLTLSLTEDRGELKGGWEFNTDLFDAATVERLAGHFRILLEAIVSDADQCLSELPLLSASERHQLLVEWNETAKDFPRTCLHELFEAQVERTPDAVALIFEDQQLSFSGLNIRANQLANYLRKLGVGPDSLVGVYMERSVEMVVALLGILKAGGAYVPLDPAYPSERLSYMVEQSRTSVILTQNQLLATAPPSAAGAIALDGELEAVSREAKENPASGASAENLAYVLFTSGSTGRPKGVETSHAGICNCLLWMQDAYGFDASERILQKTPFSFDVSLWEFFNPLIAGGTLVMARPGGHRDSRYLVEIIREQQITSVHFVPSMLQLFLEEEGANAPSLRRVVCSGEALPYNLKRRFQACMSAELHNLYGPTEASVHVTAWDCAPELPIDTVPIGRPIANIQLYVLDSRLQPVPIGVPGELHLGGVGLARGYLNQPELTAANFIPDNFSDLPGGRLYKTGDLVRYLPDGNIVYLGRIDNQLKIRGNRVEPAEIEAVLGRLPELKDVVVVPRLDASGNNALVAYLVLKQGAELSRGALRAFLKEKVPEYMVPSAFEYLEALPLNSNGKIDRKSLPEPGQHLAAESAALQGPQTDTQQRLVQLWEELLDVHPVGIQDNFFDLGGHSILAIRLFGLIEAHFGARISPSVLFHAPTIAELSEVIIRGVKADSRVRLVPIRPEGSLPPLFCICPVNHSALCFREITKDLDSAQPVFGIEGNEQILLAPLAEAAADFARIMLNTTPKGPFCLVGYSAGGVIAFEAARQLREQGHPVDFLAMLDSNDPVKPTPARILLTRARRLYRDKGHRVARLWQEICVATGFSPPRPETLDDAELKVLRFSAKVKEWELDYTPKHFPGRIVYFEAEHPPEEKAVEGWKRFIGELEIHPIPGDHAQIVVAPPLAKAIGAIIAAHLSRISDR